MIIYGKVTHFIFQSENKQYHIFNIRRYGGKWLVATYMGDEPPKPMKTVEYEFKGDMVHHPKYGDQLQVRSYSRSTVKGNNVPLNRGIQDLEVKAHQHMQNL